ncbi:MAG: alpha/beta hydrolase [Halomonas sp.]|nr:alpha/beta hydrolase [Halomonas sp.]MBP5979247.1 alpha/beta hydrolase [Halomonas sp.]
MTSLITSYDHWVAVSGGRLFARSWEPPERVSDTPIILLHDSLGCTALWRSFPEALCEKTLHRVIAYDRLGFGQSNACLEPLPLSFIDDEPDAGFAALCTALAINRFIVLGHSVGGCMAIHCAGAYASRCLGLITIAAQSANESRTRSGIEQARTAFEVPEQFSKLEKYHGHKARWVLDAWVNTWLHPDFAAWSLTPALERVHCPTLVLHGEKDEYGSLRQPERIGRHIQGPTHCEILANLHHTPHREDEAQVIRLIGAFIEELSR